MDKRKNPQQQVAELREFLEREPARPLRRRTNSSGAAVGDIDSMSYDELVAYISNPGAGPADNDQEYSEDLSQQAAYESAVAPYEPDNGGAAAQQHNPEVAPTSLPATPKATHPTVSAASGSVAQSAPNLFDSQGFDQDGYDAQGYDRQGFDRQGYDQQGFDTRGYDREGYDWDGYDKNGYDRDGYDWNGFDRDGYSREAEQQVQTEAAYDDEYGEPYSEADFDETDYDQPYSDQDELDQEDFAQDNLNDLDQSGFDSEGYDSQGFDRDGYDRQGFNREGYNRQGFDGEGYNRQGFDGEGYNRQGFNREGYNRQGFDREGYNRQGYNQQGYNRQGYNREGYNHQGFDREGYDRQGFDSQGFDREGYDRDGYDSEGYNRNNYDRDGYDWEGFDWQGFDRDGYDRQGYDWEGFDYGGFDRRGFDREGYTRQDWEAAGYKFGKRGEFILEEDQNTDEAGQPIQGTAPSRSVAEASPAHESTPAQSAVSNVPSPGQVSSAPRPAQTEREMGENGAEYDSNQAAYSKDPSGYDASDAVNSYADPDALYDESSEYEDDQGYDQSYKDMENAYGDEEANYGAAPDRGDYPAQDGNYGDEVAEYGYEQDDEPRAESEEIYGDEAEYSPVPGEEVEGPAASAVDVRMATHNRAPQYNAQTNQGAYVDDEWDGGEESDLPSDYEEYPEEDLDSRADGNVSAAPPQEQPIQQQPQTKPSPGPGILIIKTDQAFPTFLVGTTKTEDQTEVNEAVPCDYVLEYRSGPMSGWKIALMNAKLKDGCELTVGSPGTRTNVIELKESDGINEQAIIKFNRDHFTLINMGEDLNNVKVNRRPVSLDEINLLTGDELSFGETTLVFRERAVSEVLASYSLELADGVETDLGKKFVLSHQCSTIGRDRKADISLTDQEVSRNHCTLTWRGDRFFLQQRSNTDPTFINGDRLHVGAEKPITTEDQIKISSRTILKLVHHPV